MSIAKTAVMGERGNHSHSLNVILALSRLTCSKNKSKDGSSSVPRNTPISE